MTTIKYDLNQWHPSIRPEIEQTITNILAKVAPFGPGQTSILCAKTFNKMANNPRGVIKPVTEDLGYGITVRDPFTGDNVTTMSALLYGPDGDLPTLWEHKNADLSMKFHGNMNTVGADIYHEYGHAWFGMMMNVFFKPNGKGAKDTAPTKFDPDGSVVAAWIALVNDSRERREPEVISKMRNILRVPYDGQLVSQYAEQDIHEFFAETFAAVFCDKKAADNPTVKLLQNLIDAVYRQLAIVGDVTNAEPIAHRLPKSVTRTFGPPPESFSPGSVPLYQG